MPAQARELAAGGLYLSDSEETFAPWKTHREHHESLGRLPYPPHDMPKIGDPYPKDDVLEYCRHTREMVAPRVAALDLSAPSGFEWIPKTTTELSEEQTDEVLQLIARLEKDDDVQQIFHNLA